MNYLKLITVFLFFVIVSFNRPALTSKIFVLAFSPLIKGTLTVNEAKVLLRGNSYAEFEVTGKEVNCNLDIKLPVAGVNPEPITIKPKSEIYLAVYLKKSKLLKAEFALGTICKNCYYEAKEKCKKEAKLLQ